MPPRRTTYQSGRVGMVGIPSVDFSQYKAQAGLFSDLESRLNVLTDFAIKAGTVEAENRAVTNVFENEVLANTQKKNLEGMSRKDFYDMIGGEGSNAYFQKSKEVALSIITNNLNTSYTKQLEDEYASAVEQGTTPEEFYNNAYGIMQGNIDALEEIDRNTALSFGTDANKALSATYKKYNEDYLKQERINKTNDLEDQLNPKLISSSFDASDAISSIKSELDTIEKNIYSLRLTNETQNRLTANVKARAVNGYQDKMGVISDKLIENQDILTNLEIGIELNDEAIISKAMQDVASLLNDNEDVLYSNIGDVSDIGTMIIDLINYTKEDGAIIGGNELYGILIDPIYNDKARKNSEENKKNLLKANKEQDKTSMLTKYKNKESIATDIENYFNTYGEMPDLSREMTAIDNIGLSNFVKDSPNALTNVDVGILRSKEPDLTAMNVKKLYDNSPNSSVSVAELRKAGVYLPDYDYSDPNEMITLGSKSLGTILTKDYFNENLAQKRFVVSAFDYVSDTTYAFLADYEYAPDFQLSEINDILEGDDVMRREIEILFRHVKPAWDAARMQANKAGEDFDDEEWMRNHQSLFAYYRLQTEDFKIQSADYESKLYDAKMDSIKSQKGEIGNPNQGVASYEDNIIFDYGDRYTAIPLDNFSLDRSLIKKLKSADGYEESYQASADLLSDVNQAIEAIQDFHVNYQWWLGNQGEVKVQFKAKELWESTGTQLEYYLRLQEDLQNVVNLYEGD